jgi:hypothetical protein
MRCDPYFPRHIRDLRGPKIVADAPIGSYAIFADAIDEKAIAFHHAHRWTDRPRTMYIPSQFRRTSAAV